MTEQMEEQVEPVIKNLSNPRPHITEHVFISQDIFQMYDPSFKDI